MTLAPGTDLVEADFEHAVYLALFDGDRAETRTGLDAGPINDTQRGRLAARLRTLRRAEKVGLTFVVDTHGPAEVCEGFAERHRVPVVVPDSAAITALLGIEVATLRGEIEEFWRDLTAPDGSR